MINKELFKMINKELFKMINEEKSEQIWEEHCDLRKSGKIGSIERCLKSLSLSRRHIACLSPSIWLS